MRKSGIDLRLLLALLALVIAAGVIAIVAIGGSSGSSPARAKARAADYAAAGLITPARPAPPLSLRNYLGQHVNIAAYRGKAVLVITHDDRYFSCADRLIRLDYGKITRGSRHAASFLQSVSMRLRG